NVYEAQRYRHVLSTPRVVARNGELEARTSFMVARIMHTGETTLFATGCYRDRIVLDGDVVTFAEKVVVIDSRLIDTLLAIPLCRAAARVGAMVRAPGLRAGAARSPRTCREPTGSCWYRICSRARFSGRPWSYS